MAHHLATGMKVVRYILLLVLTLIYATGCDDQSKQLPTASQIDHAMVALVRDKYTRLLDQANDKTRTSSQLLLEAVTQFLADPSDATKAEFRLAWLDAHRAFTATRVLRGLMATADSALFNIDAWPIEPGFLDSLPDYPASGIVSDLSLDITTQTLIDQHGITDPEEASLGFHPLEYYAFQRTVEDFAPGTGATDTHEDYIERRRMTLRLIAETLVASVDDFITGSQLVELTAEPDHLFLARLFAGLQRAAQTAFQHASLIVDADFGHCQFSQSSLDDLRVEADLLRQVLASEGLLSLMQRYNNDSAASIEGMLSQTSDLLGLEKMTEADRTRLPLMLLLISQELDDFSRPFPLG